MTLSQNLAPSVCSIHSPQHLLAVAVERNGNINPLVAHQPVVAEIFTRSASKKITG